MHTHAANSLPPSDTVTIWSGDCVKLICQTQYDEAGIPNGSTYCVRLESGETLYSSLSYFAAWNFLQMLIEPQRDECSPEGNVVKQPEFLMH